VNVVNVKNVFNGANICVKMNADENKQFLAKNGLDNGKTTALR
jgi:hypothetical protein